jgi:hypothetical protein
MGGDGQLPVRLFYLELGSRRRDTEDVVVSRVNNHGGQRWDKAARHQKKEEITSGTISG